VTEQHRAAAGHRGRGKLDERIRKAQSDLRTFLAARSETRSILSSARDAAQEARAVRAQAERTREAARRRLHQLVTINPGRFDEKASGFRELDETRETDASVSQATQDEAFRDAVGADLSASEEFLKALSALRSASNAVKRELRQARLASRNALAVRESAANELRSAEGILQQIILSGEVASPDSVPTPRYPRASPPSGGARPEPGSSDLRVASGIRRARLPDRRDEYTGTIEDIPSISGDLASLSRELERRGWDASLRSSMARRLGESRVAGPRHGDEADVIPSSTGPPDDTTILTDLQGLRQFLREVRGPNPGQDDEPPSGHGGPG
jgi:hypothetical protein